jgi:hypothetical protein
MSFACRVSGCRFLNTHKTSQHRCGVCWEFGHGVTEHGIWQRILDVSSVAANEGDASYTTCTIPGCHASRTHTDSGHHCMRCRRRCDADHNCIISNVSNESPLPVQDAYGKLRQRWGGWQVHSHLLGGMVTDSYTTVHSFGHAWTVIVRPDGVGECAFLHSDAQGQYTPESDDRDIIEWFKGDRTEVHYSMSPRPHPPPPPHLPLPTPPSPPYPFLLGPASDSDDDDSASARMDQCPVCRADVAKSGGVTEVFGVTVDDSCSVCMDAPVSWIFTACGHMSVCEDCAQRWT